MLNREACIVMNLIPGVGFVKYSALVEHFGSPAAVREQSVEALCAVRGIGEHLAATISGFDWEGALAHELELVERAGVRLFTLLDAEYPEALRVLYDPPLCLYVRGKLPEFPQNAIAIVGTRRMSRYGATMTRMIAEGAVAAGFVIVSGLAIGVDTVAHTVSVEAGAVTVAVLGGGLMKLHPQENLHLARRIVECGGAIVSEFPMEFPVARNSFPRRNRIVAALSRGVIVTEAPEKSGALITADCALDCGRDVFAVPGPVDNLQFRGCHRRIREGTAALIENFSDVLEAFKLGIGGYLPGFSPDGGEPENLCGYGGNDAQFADMDQDSAQLLRLLGDGEKSLEELAASTRCGTGKLLGMLLRLEMKLLVEQLPGGIYRKL